MNLIEEDRVSGDPLDGALRELFSLDYLFPYQRLVAANILEAAEAAGFAPRWPSKLRETLPPAGPAPAEGEEAGDEDRRSRGRQLVILPTGAGKSLCFQLPALLLPGPTLAIYPLRSLMADQERRLREHGRILPALLQGGQDREEREAIWKKVKAGESRLIIANPETLLSPAVREQLPALGILHVVIDEAHCVSEWGESFRPDYLRIPEILEATGGGPGGPPLVTAFTATASAPVLEKIERYIFGGQGAHRIIGNPDRSNISYAAQGCILRDLAVRDLLLKNPGPAIVFCSSRPGTEKLARYLGNTRGGRELRFYHAGLNREEKTAVERWFLGSPQGVLVSTCAYGMGVDKADIRTVIHRDLPPSVEAYLQESGRAGRDGAPARAILLWGPGDETVRGGSEAARRRSAVLLDYARQVRRCRRERLLELLNSEDPGDRPPAGQCCDVCSGTAREGLREEASLAAFFRRNRRAYTLNEAVPLLAGAPAFRWTGEEARTALLGLIQRNRLRELKNFLWKDKLTLGPGT